MKSISKGSTILIVLVILLLIVAGTVFGSYNSMVKLNEDVQGMKAGIQTQLQRRGDLIPNLVETVKGYTNHEEAVFTQIADARSKLAGAGNMQELADADAQLQGALSRLLLVVENYPDLKSDTQYTALMDELAGTENRIAVARKDYNEAVQKYNATIRAFPKVIIASIFGFEKEAYFEASAVSQNPPTVSFEK